MVNLWGLDRWCVPERSERSLEVAGMLISPEADPTVAKIAETLREIVINFGFPDTTYDLAWLTAAFSNLRDEKFDHSRKWMINKVLDGQIVDGSGRTRKPCPA